MVLLLSVASTIILIQIESRQNTLKNESNKTESSYFEKQITNLVWGSIAIDVLVVTVLLSFIFFKNKRSGDTVLDEGVEDLDDILKFISDTELIGYWQSDNKGKTNISNNCYQLFGIDKDNNSFIFLSNQITILISQLEKKETGFSFTEFSYEHPINGDLALTGIAYRKSNTSKIFGMFFEGANKIEKRNLEKKSNELINWQKNIDIPFVIFKPIYNNEGEIIDFIYKKTNSLFYKLLEFQNNNLGLTKYSENQLLGEIDLILTEVKDINEKHSILINTYNPNIDKYFTLRFIFLDKLRIAVLIEDHTKVISHINTIEKNLDLYKTIFELIDFPTIIIDSEKLIIHHCNTAAVQLFQAKSKEALCEIDFELLSPIVQENDINSLDLIKSTIVNLKKNQINTYDNWKFVKTNGEQFIANLRFFIPENSSDKQICITINNISHFSKIKENYEKSQKWLQTIMDSVLSHIVVKDVYGKIIACNNAYKETFGNKSSVIIGKYNEEIYTEDEAIAIKEIDNEIIKLGFERTYEQQLYTNDNKKRIFLITKNPLKDENGKVYAIVAHGTDISVIKTLENKLYHAQLEATIANNAKSVFLANMSHEIRTPINAIIGYSELLKKRDYDEKTKDYINSIYSSGNSLLGLINHVLELSKIEAGKIEVNKEFTDMINVFNSMKDIFKLKAEQKGIELLFEIKNNPDIWFNIDLQKLKQVLTNLISNAIKFTKKGFVKVIFNYNLLPDNMSDVEIKVIDTGVGISDTDYKKLFKPFSPEFRTFL